MIKLIATDLDGTFLNDDNQFPDDFSDVFDMLREQGIVFGAASGRQYYNLLSRFDGFHKDMLFIAENGTYVVYKGQELYSNTLDRETAYELVKIGRGIPDCHIVLCGKNYAYVESDQPEVLKEVDKYYAKRKIVDDLLEIEDDFLKVTILDFEGAEHNSNRYFDAYRDRLQITVGGFIWLDIMNAGANKGIAISKIQEHLNITKEETMVFGDYLNDLEMMDSAHYSYAMANAHDKVKEAARFQAKSNNEAGVTATIRQMVSV
ncbi:MAG: Cof-type HAD-IIB family hydrolase [Bacillus sp. (in: firmicutes)]